VAYNPAAERLAVLHPGRGTSTSPPRSRQVPRPPTRGCSRPGSRQPIPRPSARWTSASARVPAGHPRADWCKTVDSGVLAGLNQGVRGWGVRYSWLAYSQPYGATVTGGPAANLARPAWTVTAVSSDPARSHRQHDRRNPDTRWSSGHGQTPGDWVPGRPSAPRPPSARVLARRRSEHRRLRAPRYEVQVSTGRVGLDRDRPRQAKGGVRTLGVMTIPLPGDHRPATSGSSARQARAAGGRSPSSTSASPPAAPAATAAACEPPPRPSPTDRPADRRRSPPATTPAMPLRRWPSRSPDSTTPTACRQPPQSPSPPGRHREQPRPGYPAAGARGQEHRPRGMCWAERPFSRMPVVPAWTATTLRSASAIGPVQTASSSRCCRVLTPFAAGDDGRSRGGSQRRRGGRKSRSQPQGRYRWLCCWSSCPGACFPRCSSSVVLPLARRSGPAAHPVRQDHSVLDPDAPAGFELRAYGTDRGLAVGDPALPRARPGGRRAAGAPRPAAGRRRAADRRSRAPFRSSSVTRPAEVPPATDPRAQGGPQHQPSRDCAVMRFFSVSYARRYSRAGEGLGQRHDSSFGVVVRPPHAAGVAGHPAGVRGEGAPEQELDRGVGGCAARRERVVDGPGRGGAASSGARRARAAGPSHGACSPARSPVGSPVSGRGRPSVTWGCQQTGCTVITSDFAHDISDGKRRCCSKTAVLTLFAHPATASMSNA